MGVKAVFTDRRFAGHIGTQNCPKYKAQGQQLPGSKRARLAIFQAFCILFAMSVVCDLESFSPAARGGVLCIGNFDGVHRGHARMLACGRTLATQCGRPFVMMTFAIHPLSILTPKTAPPSLMTLNQRLELLQSFSPDTIILLQPDPQFLAMAAETFLHEVVVSTIGAKHMVEGPSFTFGCGAAGDVAMLEKQHAAYGFDFTVVPTVATTLADLTEVTVSSSLCRWLITHGRVQDAAQLLGRPYTLRSVVIHGQGRGKKMGYPTVNLAVQQLLPAQGVYAGRALVAGCWYPAAISVGTNSTFGQHQVSVEAFLLDFSGDIYEASIDLAFDQWIRDQQSFAGMEPLQRRITLDVQTVRHVHEKFKPIRAISDVNHMPPGQAVPAPAAILCQGQQS